MIFVQLQLCYIELRHTHEIIFRDIVQILIVKEDSKEQKLFKKNQVI